MGKIGNVLNELSPYLIGIRYLDGVALVDVVLKTGWSIIDSTGIKSVKGDESMNYYMFFSEEPSIGLDELLAYVRKIINLNLDREKKQDLLNEKIVELKKIFKQNDLKQLGKLKFSFEDNRDEYSHKLYEEHETFDETETFHVNTIDEEPKKPIINEALQEDYNTAREPFVFLDENKQPIQMTEEEMEILEEEARAERNIMMTKNKIKPVAKPMTNIDKVELPPKSKMSYSNQGCDCGPEQACGSCIDNKY